MSPVLFKPSWCPWLNGCPAFKGHYIAAHDGIAALTTNERRNIFNHTTFDNNETVQRVKWFPLLFENRVTPDYAINHPPNTSDIVLINESNKAVIILKTSGPFDAYMDICCASKLFEYWEIEQEQDARFLWPRAFYYAVSDYARWIFRDSCTLQSQPPCNALNTCVHMSSIFSTVGHRHQRCMCGLQFCGRKKANQLPKPCLASATIVCFITWKHSCQLYLCCAYYGLALRCC